MRSFLLGAIGAITILAAFEAGRQLAPVARQPNPEDKYSLHDFRDKFLVGGVAGVENNMVLRINENTGETWQLSTLDVPIGATLEDGKNATQRVIGWEPVAPDYILAIQEVWQKYGTPAPKKN
jgi:hypothetical protein